MIHKLMAIFAMLFLPLGLSSCGGSKAPTTEAAYESPWQTRARDVARAALVEWTATGTVPDSIEKVLRHHKLIPLTGWDGGLNKVYTTLPAVSGGNYHCTYAPFVRHPANVLFGEREPEVLGFQVVTWSGGDVVTQARCVIIGTYGPEGKPTLFEVQGFN